MMFCPSCQILFPVNATKKRRADLTHEQLETPPMASCPNRICPTGRDCIPFASTCQSVADCVPESCCVVLDLDVIDSNIPGRSLPEAYISTCGSNNKNKIYCAKVCGRTVPDWSDFF